MSEPLDEFEKDGLELGIKPEPEEEKPDAPAEEKDLEPEKVETKTEEEPKTEDKEEGEEDDNPQPKGKFNWQEFNKIRSQNRELLTAREQWEEERATLLEKSSKYDEIESAKTKEERIKAAAIKLAGAEATPEVLAATENQIRVLEEVFAKPETAASNKELQEAKDKLAATEDEKVFNSEWKEFAGTTLKNEFKGASEEQLEAAQEAMDELAHAPQFSDKEFDYVYFKNRDIFQEIFKTKPSRTFESKDIYHEEGEDKPDLEEKYKGKAAKDIPIRDLEKMDREMTEQARRQDEDSGWNVHNPQL